MQAVKKAIYHPLPLKCERLLLLSRRYEKIFGPTYVSTGGQATTTKFCNDMELSADKKVLDIGCGIGGSAFYMARRYGCLVNGVDLSTNMINIANAYRYYISREKKKQYWSLVCST